MRLDVTIDDRELRQLVDRIPRRIDNGVRTVAHALEAEAVDNAPRKDGDLSSSIHVDENAPADHSVSTNVNADDGQPYDVYQEFGTGLKAEDWEGRALASRHRIFPREKKFMMFEWNGQTVYRRSVAGVTPRHYMGNALTSIEPRIPAMFKLGFESLP